jgi:hypothetical protein
MPDNHIFAQNIKSHDMANPIKAVPILSGKLADDFERLAEENSRKPRRTSTEEQRAIVREMEKQLRKFVPSWRK